MLTACADRNRGPQNTGRISTCFRPEGAQKGTSVVPRSNDYELQVADSNRSALSAACRGAEGLEAPIELFEADDLIFAANRRGRYIGHDNLIKRQFLPLFANVKAKRFKWHGLRHFAVSTSIEAGLSPKTVQTFAEVEIFSQRHMTTGVSFVGELPTGYAEVPLSVSDDAPRRA